MPMQENPTQLKPALVFGLAYAAVLFALAAAKYQFGNQGLYLVAGLSGLTEMDAITLSTARLSLVDAGVLADGWRLIVVAAMANMVSKACLAGLLGGWRLAVRMALLFGVPLAGGAAMLAALSSLTGRQVDGLLRPLRLARPLHLPSDHPLLEP